MKIKLIDKKYTTTKIDKYCCRDMKRMLKHSWELNNDGILFDDRFTGYEPINYCPFCGEKIDINW